MLQNRSPASRGEGEKKMEEEKEGESERRLKVAVKHWLSSFLLTNLRNDTFRLPTLDPLSLKMISTSRILPNCWKKKKKVKRLNVSHVLHLATGCQHCSTMTSWHCARSSSLFFHNIFLASALFSAPHFKDIPLQKKKKRVELKAKLPF